MTKRYPIVWESYRVYHYFSSAPSARDFEVMSEVATTGGVSIKCEMFYGLPRRRISLPRS